jgi:hypothetical protein
MPALAPKRNRRVLLVQSTSQGLHVLHSPFAEPNEASRRRDSESDGATVSRILASLTAVLNGAN